MALRLNLACGKNLKDGWVNVDLHRPIEGLLHIDLKERWPWDALSAEQVYCEHFLEHLEWPLEADFFLSEAFRVLERSGTIRIGVPDANLPLQFWDHPIAAFWKHLDKISPKNARTRMEQVQWWYRQNGHHKWMYDEESLTRILKRAGFVNVRKRFYSASMDSHVREIETLYMEAMKP